MANRESPIIWNLTTAEQEELREIYRRKFGELRAEIAEESRAELYGVSIERLRARDYGPSRVLWWRKEELDYAPPAPTEYDSEPEPQPEVEPSPEYASEPVARVISLMEYRARKARKIPL